MSSICILEKGIFLDQVKGNSNGHVQYGKSVTFGTPNYESAYKAGQVQGKV
jgi:hypothetical protein